MGTNYYLHKPPCPTCNHAEEPIHIGKSSAGWCFSLCYNKGLGLTSLNAWFDYLRENTGDKKGSVRDEYDEDISLTDLSRIITMRSNDKPIDQARVDLVNKHSAEFGGRHTADVEEYLLRNHAIIGPNNLLRHKLAETPEDNCVSHGEGTWDMLTGEFS